MPTAGTFAPLNWLLFIQGLFYVITGLWPLFSMRTFEKITGPKTDKWMVKTFGLVLSVDGFIFLGSSFLQPSVSTVILSIGTALVLLSVDLRYTIKKIISKVYLVDAVAEAAFAAVWIWLFANT
jgi:hypothetical protein